MYLEARSALRRLAIDAVMNRFVLWPASWPTSRSKLCRETALTKWSVLRQLQSWNEFVFSLIEFVEVAPHSRGRSV